jgi:hypothetical protein
MPAPSWYRLGALLGPRVDCADAQRDLRRQLVAVAPQLGGTPFAGAAGDSLVDTPRGHAVP